jgi:hypothetical protein
MTDFAAQTWHERGYYDWVAVSPDDWSSQDDAGPHVHLDASVCGNVRVAWCIWHDVDSGVEGKCPGRQLNAGVGGGEGPGRATGRRTPGPARHR